MNEIEKDEDEFCYFKRLKVINSSKFGDITLREFDSICSDGSIIIVGLNASLSTALTTKCTIHIPIFFQPLTLHSRKIDIIGKLELPVIGDIVSKKIPNLALVSNGFPTHGCRIHGNKRVVIFTSEFDFKKPEIQNDIVASIFDFAKRHRNPLIITIDEVSEIPNKPKIHIKEKNDEECFPITKKRDLLEQIYFDRRIWFLTNDRNLGKKMIKNGHHSIKQMDVIGISGGILAESTFQLDTKICSLYGTADPVLKDNVNILNRTAMDMIVCIDEIIDKVSFNDISKKRDEVNEKIEEKLKELVRKIQTPPSQKPPLAWSGLWM